MIAAPREEAEELWRLPPKQFNAWRAKHDFPRIVTYLKKYLPEFERWRDSQGLDDQTLCDFGLGRFLRPRIFYEYVFPVDPHRSPSGRHFWNQDIDPALRADIQSKRTIIPYFLWIKAQKVQLSRDILALGVGITGWTGAHGSRVLRASVFREVELVWLGGQTLPDGFQLGDRHLEFSSLDGLVLEGNVWNSQYLHLIGCSARNLTVRARMAFVDAYQSSFESLTIERARLQDWSFERCDVTGFIEASTLFRCRFLKGGFMPAISNSDLNQCTFDYQIERAHDVGGARDFHGYALRQLSACGRLAEAGEQAYRKKTLEMRMHANPIYYFGEEFPPKRVYNGSFSDLIGDWQRGWWDDKKFRELLLALARYHIGLLRSPRSIARVLKHWTKSAALFLSWAAWGFSERPWRVLANVGVILLGAAGLYYFFGVPATKGDLGASLYFSIVTFTTLGYGDITQVGWLRQVAAFEALLGALAMGLLVSSLASRSRY
jgi:hypothetical protein